MSPIINSEFCPYVGLQPYTEEYRAYFFGRERDQKIIASNLYAASLTVLYGASGVGKTSVLLAGVIPQLKTLPRLAVVFYREWQNADFLNALKRKVLASIKRDVGEDVEVDMELRLDKFLEVCTRTFRGHIFFILDQFDEYFLYHAVTPTTDEFEAGLACSINRPELPANFLLSMRDDGLSQLDRFLGRIPNLLSNILRLERLDPEAAENAIRKPLIEYNRHLPEGQATMDIEDALVERLLLDLQEGKVKLDLTGQGQVNTLAQNSSVAAKIETPFLQLVLQRLWETEKAAHSRMLQLKTYEHLGGAAKIVGTHLDEVMDAESFRDLLDVAADVFHYLVTPSGVKIAHTEKDLAFYTKRPAEDVKAVLKTLSSPKVSILRVVMPPLGQLEVPRYEIYHDVLAPAILDWRARYLLRRKQAETQAQAVSINKKIQSKFMEQPASKVGVISLTANILDRQGLSKTIWRWEDFRTVHQNVTRDVIRGELWFGPTSQILKKPSFKYVFPRTVTPEIIELDNYKFKYQIHIDGLLNYGESLGYEFRVEVANAFFMNREDFAKYTEKEPQAFNKEYWGYSILIPVDKLELNLTFPQGYVVETYPGACIGELVVEDQLFDQEIQRIQDNGWLVKNGNSVQLTVQNPIMGLSYFIYWEPLPKQRG
jgi:hypothetical protein